MVIEGAWTYKGKEEALINCTKSLKFYGLHKYKVLSHDRKRIHCQSPVLGLGLGCDLTFTWDNNNNNDNDNNDKNNPNLNFLKGTVLEDKEQGIGIGYKGIRDKGQGARDKE